MFFCCFQENVFWRRFSLIVYTQPTPSIISKTMYEVHFVSLACWHTGLSLSARNCQCVRIDDFISWALVQNSASVSPCDATYFLFFGASGFFFSCWIFTRSGVLVFWMLLRSYIVGILSGNILVVSFFFSEVSSGFPSTCSYDTRSAWIMKSYAPKLLL